MPLHTPKTIKTCKNKYVLFDSKSLKQRFSSFTFYKKQRSYKKIMCVYFLFHWFSGENCMFSHSLRKGWQTSKELKRNMNDGTIIFFY